MAETRLIDANALRIDAEKSFHDWPVIRGDIDRMINRQPTIDPENLRPKGRWVSIECKPHLMYECSLCKAKWGYGAMLSMKFCPNCGAKMEV